MDITTEKNIYNLCLSKYLRHRIFQALILHFMYLVYGIYFASDIFSHFHRQFLLICFFSIKDEWNEGISFRKKDLSTACFIKKVFSV